ncbi:divalent cation transporter domain-containing protein [Ditylenchus destructor]|uniref:Divalent cation transporter domain-containing protein n=1 Tax=Ditylenchus destructor TaxID=166010 RepID=A0AAD4N1E6_9BILA|nr:divalent cation transporter domain-containing protein [Ditylenchus destructor]
MGPLFAGANGQSKPPIQQKVIKVNVVNIKIQPVIQANSTSDKKPLVHNQDESCKGFLIETIVPFMLAGCGMVAAGVLLEKATKWVFLNEVPETLILVPALLGLKGNLEMTLASRLSTMANMGLMDERKQQVNVFVSNIALIQAQAIVVSLVAAAIAIISGGIHDPKLMLCLTLSTVLTASAASFVLASLMVFIAILARKKGINPDNIATPVAGATGDVTTLTFLILIGTFFYEHRHLVVLNGILLGSMLLSSLWWMWVASRQQATLQVLKYGWFAVLLAMLISSGGGYIMEQAVEAYPNIPVFQPVINGVGGNLVAVQASKISTYFHQFGKKGVLPANRLLTYLNPLRTFACKEKESTQAWVLLGMALPGHIIFGALIFLVQSNSIRFYILFFVFYLAIALIQVSLLLYICQWLSRAIWLLKCNPDNNAIPLLTAMGDLLGTLLLAAAFTFYDLTGGAKLEVERLHIEARNLHNITDSATFAPNATFSVHH